MQTGTNPLLTSMNSTMNECIPERKKNEETQLGSFVWCVAVRRLLSLVENDSGLQYLHTMLTPEFTLFIRIASFLEVKQTCIHHMQA